MFASRVYTNFIAFLKHTKFLFFSLWVSQPTVVLTTLKCVLTFFNDITPLESLVIHSENEYKIFDVLDFFHLAFFLPLFSFIGCVECVCSGGLYSSFLVFSKKNYTCTIATNCPKGSLPFLHVLLKRDGQEIYEKRTHTDQNLHYRLHYYPHIKAGIISCLGHRAHNLCKDTNIRNRISHLQQTFGANGPLPWIVQRLLHKHDDNDH